MSNDHKRSSLGREKQPQNLLISQEGWEADHDLETDQELSLGDRAADAVTGFYGSWIFLWWQLGILGFWALANTSMLIIKITHVLPWDPYPFVFMNLMLSTEAAFSGILVLMSNNRAAANARVLADEVRRTTNRAWANTERIESLSEMMMFAMENNFATHAETIHKIDNTLSINEKARQAFAVDLKKILDDFSSMFAQREAKDDAHHADLQTILNLLRKKE